MLNSYTHCQAAPANAKTQAWQRVCLPNRTTKTTEKTSCIMHMADSAKFEGATFNKLFSDAFFKVRASNRPNDTIHVTVSVHTKRPKNIDESAPKNPIFFKKLKNAG